MKLTCWESTLILYLMRGLKELLLYKEWLKFAILRLFKVEAVCPKKPEFSQFESNLLEKETFRPPHWIKNVACTAQSPILFLRTYIHRIKFAPPQ